MPESKEGVRVYLRGSVWYGECTECPAEHQRLRSTLLPTTHGMARRHVAKHRAEER
ncbi:MAG TPA: hypothetical protein VHG10_00740 [Glycomyces sp.]|nr:hypothetical protein [Glycomyces sp.]